MKQQDYYSVYKNELLNNIIPFWEKYCVDDIYGGYFTFLDRDGSVYNTDKYMWTQWRIVYMFAELYKSEFSQRNWLNIAKKGYDFLVKHGKSDDGNYYFALNGEGVPILAPYSIYSECFVTMGSAALYNATGEKKYYDEAISSMNNFINRIDKPKGIWTKAMPGKTKMHTLGHYMMLANMGLIVKEYLKIDKYDKDVLKGVEFVLSHFYNKEFGVIFENITTDFKFDLESCDGRHINPGHGLEALWFIMRIGEKYGRDDIIDKSTKIVESIMEFSWDKKYGGIFYFMDVLDKPHLELQWDMKLWWVHNEALVAILMAYKFTNKKSFSEWFEKLHEWTWGNFPDSEYGEWFAYLNRRGEPTSFMKGGKWKTFFHLPRALYICQDLLKVKNNK